MKIMYFSPAEYHLKQLNKVVIKVAATVTLTLTLMTNTGCAANPDNYIVDTKNQIGDVQVTQLPKCSKDITFKESGITILLQNNEVTCADMMNAAVQRLGLGEDATKYNSKLMDKMTEKLQSIPAVKVTADYDSHERCLEFVFLLKGELIAAVSKVADSIDNNRALLTFVYKRTVVWAGEVNLSEVAEHICSIGSKL